MKALILAAGYATRMYPLTENQPKPLLKVRDTSIIEHIIRQINHIKEIEEIFVVTNARFYDHFVHWLKEAQFDKTKVTLVNDQTLTKEDRLGAIGDIQFVLREKNVSEDLLILGGDNLFTEKLDLFIRTFNICGGSLIALNDVQKKELAKLYGIVTLDQSKRIIKFTEKPAEPESTLASTLIYALKKEHLLLLPEAIKAGAADRTGDFIKYLSERKPVYGHQLSGTWFDIGSFEQLKEAEK